MIGVDDTLDDATDQTAPVWAVFGDLMAGLLGAFVLILVGVLVVQIDLVASLQQEVQKRQMEEQRRMALEKALAVPLAAGRVTVNNGRIGISGSVLFATGSDELRTEGRQLLKSLVQPLGGWSGDDGHSATGARLISLRRVAHGGGGAARTVDMKRIGGRLGVGGQGRCAQ